MEGNEAVGEADDCPGDLGRQRLWGPAQAHDAAYHGVGELEARGALRAAKDKVGEASDFVVWEAIPYGVHRANTLCALPAEVSSLVHTFVIDASEWRSRNFYIFEKKLMVNVMLRRRKKIEKLP